MKFPMGNGQTHRRKTDFIMYLYTHKKKRPNYMFYKTGLEADFEPLFISQWLCNYAVSAMHTMTRIRIMAAEYNMA